MHREHILSTLDHERNQIRLLYLDRPLLPASNAAPALRGKLDSVSPLEAPRYSALSYVWGDPKAVSSVYLNDGSHIPLRRIFSAHLRT
jgi:hypothetical protein